MGETLDTWPAGATFVFHINIANEGAAGASDIELIYQAGEGSEFELLYGRIVNDDTVNRVVQAFIDTGTSGQNVGQLDSQTIAAGGGMGIPKSPVTGTDAAASSTRWIVSGPMRLRMLVASVADGQDATFGGVLRIKGQSPTRTTVGAGTEVVTVNMERVV